MKRITAIVSFLLLGILTAVYVGFGFPGGKNDLPIDRELEGLEKKYVIRFSHVVASDSPKGLAANYFADLVSEKTNGWVEVQIFPNGVLYDAQQEFAALKRGDVQMIAPAFSEVMVHDVNWAIMDMPYLFADDDDIRAALDGNIGQLLLESLQAKGYLGLTFWENGFKQPINRECPIRRPEDMNSLRMRIMPSEALADMYTLLGAQPHPAPFNEVYQLLHERSIDGTENTPTNIYTKGFYKEQLYLTVTNHNYLGYVVIVNESFWNGLPRDYRKAVQEALAEVSLKMHSEAVALNRKHLQKLTDSTLDVHVQSAAEKRTWIEALKPLYAKYRALISPDLAAEMKKLQQREQKEQKDQ
ncbi:DctP family TRAP transporter solute-binding subunit [Numidum massiliense]|uniref:DctP family TRAP transporter solute-binding subunit n=1 Tax=Numidum massiliense TaxID=1522315 RepID=UPI0006D5369E|nr:DctP family TRAP transporter solute-binding subunit [Numidum massiliense]